MTDQNPSPDALPLTQRLYQGDPLLVWLRDRRRISYPVWVVGLALLGFALLAVPMPLFGAPMDSRDLAIAALQGFVIMPLGFSLYLLMPDFIAGLFDSLGNGGMIGGPRRVGDREYPSFTDLLVASTNSRWWVAGALLLVALYWYYRLRLHFEINATMNVPDQYPLGVRLALLLFYSPLLYGAVLSLARLLVGLLYSQRLFRQFKLQVNPLNPDGAGGLSQVGRMLVLSVLVAALLGAAAALIIILNIALGQNPFTRADTIALGVIYLVFTPLLFAIWLWAPHQALLDVRQEALQPLADEYMHAAAQAMPASGESAEDIKAKTERLVEIKRQYELVRDTFPIWPLPDQTLKRLVTVSSLPALSPLLTGLVIRLGDYLLQLFQPH